MTMIMNFLIGNPRKKKLFPDSPELKEGERAYYLHKEKVYITANNLENAFLMTLGFEPLKIEEKDAIKSKS